MPVSLLYPNRRQIPPRVQAVMAWITHVVTPYLAETDPESVDKGPEGSVDGP